MKIIRANLGHIGKIIPLFNAYRMFYQQSSDILRAEKFITERLRNSESIIFLALDEKTPDFPGIGFTQLYLGWGSIGAQRILTLSDLYVDIEYRKRNIGRLLVRSAREYAKQEGIEKIYLSTEASNFAGQKLYESEGYIKDTNFINYSLCVPIEML